MHSIPGLKGVTLTTKLNELSNKNEGLKILRKINSVLLSENVHLEDLYQDPTILSCFKYAPITSVDVKRTSGDRVELLANYFPINSPKNWYLYEYNVDFEIDEHIMISTKTELLDQHREYLGVYLFDGTMLFTSNKLDSNTTEFVSTRRSDGQVIIFTVEFSNVLKIYDYASIQFLNMLLRKCLTHIQFIPIGRNFYDLDAKIEMAQHKLQLWRGYEATIDRYESGVLLCANLTTKLIPQDTVLDLFYQCSVDRSRNKNWEINFKTSVIGTTVMTKYNYKTYIIVDIDENARPNSEFTKNDRSKITYKQYYKEKWNITILDDYQPLLIAKNKISLPQFGFDDNLVYLVPELCVIVGITNSLRNNFTLMNDMILHTRVYPKEWIERLTNFSDHLFFNSNSEAELKKWNLTLNNNLIKVPGRVLLPEKILSRWITYDGGKEADWSKHSTSVPMLISANVKNWVILASRNFYHDVEEFSKTIVRAAQKLEFILPNPEIIPMNDERPNTFIQHLDDVIDKLNPALILCVIKSPCSDIYGTIKRKLCVDRAVPSQVVTLRNVQNNDMFICTKIAIKINCKLGGIPWQVPIPKSGMMIVGCNIYEDTQQKNKSFGALISTMDDNHTSYFNYVKPYENLRQLSIHFSIGITKALWRYNTKYGSLPTSIMIYRDGVEEGQSFHVRTAEVKLFQATFERFYGPNSVPFAFIVVTKNNESKFFVPGRRGPENPLPGTIIDSVVTNPTKYEFFLVSQQVKQGTVSPTHYEVIEDTLKLPPDVIQRFTFKLTHNYFNWSGTTQTPAPCQLAHKLARLTGESLGCSPNFRLHESLFFL
ncbi:piwi-like protein Siwi [Melanaphis sacchari]|uniref:piwi-like protein Siwi n=1 Tax=Melanaphis sacchari TaxID=742174 RepID=UPI000DC147D4|nr:piwi-like protein Siwi [Melanaphis sacchari]